MEKNRKYRRTDQVLSSAINSEHILLSLETNSYYGLEEVSSKIWELLKSPMSLDDIIHSLIGEYEVSKESCKQDTLLFLNALREENLIEILDE